MPPEIIAAVIAGLATIAGPVVAHYIGKRNSRKDSSLGEVEEDSPESSPTQPTTGDPPATGEQTRRADYDKVSLRNVNLPSSSSGEPAPSTSVADSDRSKIKSKLSQQIVTHSPIYSSDNIQLELNKVDLETPKGFRQGGLSCVYFLNGEVGWAAGSAGNLFRTRDGGRHWERFRRETKALIKDIFFFDETTGWSVATDGLWKTKDGGKHWEPTVGLEQPTAMKQKLVPEDLEKRIHELGLEDAAGVLWGVEGTPNRLQEGVFNRLVFFEEFGWAIGGGGSTLRTQDRGRTWEYVRLEQNFNLRDLFFLDRYRGWIVGDNGRILGTEDGGLTWENLRVVDTRSALASIWMLNQRVGWAVGWSGQILYTEDGGRYWKRKHLKLTGSHLTTIAFRNSSEGWIVGAGGTLLHTTSAGNKWTLKEFYEEIRGQFNDLFILPESASRGELYGYAVGGDGWMLRIYRSDG